MTIHYHGTPITPVRELQKLAGRCFCVSYYSPRDVERVHKIGQAVLLDNGAFTYWRKKIAPKWDGYYDWVDRWLDYPLTWAIIPDVINGSDEDNDRLIADWPHGQRGAPVWHYESIDRLLHLADNWDRVCFGSTEQYPVGSLKWHHRTTEAMNAIFKRHRVKWIHMLRGMAVIDQFSFASVDSADIARNHHQRHGVEKMAARWDAINSTFPWKRREEQLCIK